MRYKGNLTGGQIDKLGDIMSHKSLENIAKNAIGTAIWYNFKHDHVIGQVVEAEYNLKTNMIEIVARFIGDIKIRIGHGLSIGGRIKKTQRFDNNRYYNVDITVIDDYELQEVSIIDMPIHPNWVITGEVEDA